MRKYRKRAKILQAMSHPVRLQILDILAQGPACVCELISRTRQRQAYISQQLMLLRQSGMVKSTRFGLNIQYELAQPDITRQMLRCVLQEPQSKAQDSEESKTLNAPNANQWHGITRDQIQWFPTVVAERCNGCGLCATSCGKNVYAFNYEANKPVVVDPESCMVGCAACAVICTQDAIELPSFSYVRQEIKKNKVLTQARNMLTADPDKYDVKKHMPVAD